MSRLPDLADRIERLLLRHDEQKRTNALLEQQLRNVTDERDNLRSRLAAARARIDALIDRLPASEGGHASDDSAGKAAAEPGAPVETGDTAIPGSMPS
jgi:cell division protein ZapB